METTCAESPVNTVKKPTSSLMVSEESVGVDSQGEGTKNSQRKRNFTFYLTGDEITILSRNRWVVINPRHVTGFVVPTDDGVGDSILIGLPQVWSWKNQVLFYLTLEHEILHHVICGVEGWDAAKALDETWWGGEYIDFMLGEGYDKEML